jgi:suppressor for copper-sensitivity B
MLAFALLGGLILNLMPCVLPVMGMKLSSVLNAGSDKRKIRLRFLATSAGILTSFVLLAVMVSALKLTGASLGWGIQFQSPWFIGLMVAVTFLFALNLFGVFEMLLPSAAMGRLATTGARGLPAVSVKVCLPLCSRHRVLHRFSVRQWRLRWAHRYRNCGLFF